jgi:uncharacterized lipoprotein YehR (DUF1307 family)
MVDTTIRVKDKTYKAIVRTRGAFEQTFGMKLTLDQVMFLAASYVNIAYEEFQTLSHKKLIEIVTENDGLLNIRWTKLEEILKEVLPRLMTAFLNFKKMLNEKEHESTVTVGA